MKKHILKLSLIALLGFGLFACGNDDTSSASSTPASSNTTTSVATSSTTSSATSSATEEVKLSKVSEVKTIAKGTKVKFRATYQGKNNKVFKDSKLGNVWYGTFVADGNDWIQLFKCDEKLLTSDIALGDVIEVEGTTAHNEYKGVTTPEVTATSIKKVTDEDEKIEILFSLLYPESDTHSEIVLSIKKENDGFSYLSYVHK